MRNLRRFETVAQLNAAIANSTIGLVGLAFDEHGKPVIKNKQGSSPVPPTPSTSTPFYVENINNEAETLTISGYDLSEQDNYLQIPVEYSTDGTNWSSLGTTGETPLTRPLQPGDKVYLRATTDAWYERQDEPYIEHGCGITGISKVGGNIMSLLYGSNFTGNETTFPSGSSYNFSGLFANNEELVHVSDLILPATTLAYCCYQSMFESCTSLTTAPALPATTLVGACYNYMFGGCSSLATAPALPATTLAQDCYSNMFNGCTSLTTAPALPATTLAQYCYQEMFYGCTNLNYIKCLATDISASSSTQYWLYNVAASGTFVKNPSMSSWTTGVDGIPSGWTVENATA